MNNKEITEHTIKNKICTLRGVQVLLDRDLADFYGIENRALKQAINRNKERFPEDFMFILQDKEIDYLVSQSVIPSKQHLRGAKPYAFTEQGVANIASVLTSKKWFAFSRIEKDSFELLRRLNKERFMKSIYK